jgi:hypothetical protein
MCPSPKPSARGLRDEISSFNKITDTDMVDDTVTHADIYIESERSTIQYCRDREAKETPKAEMVASFISLYLTGTKNGHHTNVIELWNSDGTRIEILRA